jgi:glycosyltransferase involved in cell wall biosynthesis
MVKPVPADRFIMEVHAMSVGLSIIIPVFNEADIIEANTERLLDFMNSLNTPFEIILASNGSTDQTIEIGRILAERHPDVRFFSLAEKGVGRAFVMGVSHAQYDAIVSLDMDLSIDLDLIPQAARLLSDYEIVVGSKKMGSQRRTLWRKAGSTTFIITVKLLLGLSFEDYSIAAKAYRKNVIEGYLPRIDHGTSYVLDMIYHTLANGGRAVEIPVHCEDFRTSKFNLTREALYRFRNLFLLWWQYHVPARLKSLSPHSHKNTS